MADIELTFPDGSKHKFKAGTTGFEVAKSIGEGLAKAAVGVKVEKELLDLHRPLAVSGKFEVITPKSKDCKEFLWHSTAHVLAESVKTLFPEVKITIGPTIEEGFYYDFDMPRPFTPEDFAKIEARMAEIVKADKPFKRLEVSKAEALKREKGNKYKAELINELPANEKISFYSQGENFVDLCRGPHLPSTGRVGAFKLLKASSAYWRGDQKNASLQRIYGISFLEKKELDQWQHVREEAEKRNHMKLGKELDLWSMHPESPGSVFMHGKGMAVYNELINFMSRELFQLGYDFVNTPVLLKNTLWKTSGHWEHYKQNMYCLEIDDEDFALKPMNCPPSTILYGNRRRSYRDLPLKLAEFGLVHRHELSGVLNGLFRVRRFVQDDAHIYATEDQIEEQITELLQLTDRVYKTFGFSYHIELSTKPEKSMGEAKLWAQAEAALEKALKDNKLPYKVNPGDGAFYGPKIDFHLKDAIGRTWQCGTIQLDFQMPERFDLVYIGADDKEHRPVMIHRAILGSIERFLGVLTEQFMGAFPVWLAPVQARLVPVGQDFFGYADEVVKKLRLRMIRCDADKKHDTVNYKVRAAQLEKIPYILVVGEKEVKEGTVTVRDRAGKLTPMKVEAFIEKVAREVGERSLN